MRCTTCGYALWNLKDRQCPECGEGYSPSSYDFVPNTVRFGCPECDQAYFGTDPRGQLIPDEFDCVSCGTHLHADIMVLRPRDGVAEQDTAVKPLPWVDRAQLGWWRAFWKTITATLIRPGTIGTGVEPTLRPSGALRFGLLAQVAVVLIAMIPSVLFVGVMPLMAGGRGGGGVAAIGVLAAIILGAIPIGLLGYFVIFFLWASCAHLFLKVTGGTAFGFRRTFDTVCYSSGANIISAIPCLGGYVGWIWWAVSLSIGLRASQRVSGLRATLAAISFPLIFIALIITGYILMFMAIFGAGGFGGANFGNFQQGIGPALSAQIATKPEYTSIEQPLHSSKLIVDGQINAFDLTLLGSSQTNMGQMAIGETQAFMLAPDFSPSQAAIDAAVNSLDPGTVAHRLGDHVFTYHGLDLNADNSALWIAITTPDPDANIDAPFFITSFGPRTSPYLEAVNFDGSTERFNEVTWQAAFDAQNLARIAAGLPPLDPPETITSDIPQVLDPAQWPTAGEPAIADPD